MPDSKIVIIAVHGTFAPDAGWAQQGSYLHRALLTLLREPVYWIPFRWGTGRNSHKARLAACTDLEKAIRGAAQTFRGSSIYVIAHSHGGNVALMALSRLAPECPVRGVVCLSTPYISARRRAIDPFEGHQTTFGLLVGVILPILTMLGISLPVYALFGDTLAVLAFFAGLPLSIWLFGKLLSSSSSFAADDEARQVNLLMAYDYRHIVAPILSLRTTLDEAYWFVRGLSVLGVAPVLLHKHSAALLSLSYGVLFVYGLLTGDPMFMIGAIMLGGATSCLWLAALYWCGLLRIPAWGEKLTDGFEMQFSLSTDPPPELFSVSRVLSANSTFKSSLLRHSRLYNSLQAAQVIATFMESDVVVAPAKTGSRKTSSGAS